MSDSEESMEMAGVYKWLDEIPLTRAKKNVSRDFADGVLMAELLKHFYPRLVDMHNYSAVNRLTAKIINWETLNKRVLSKLNLSISQSAIHAIASGIPGALESLLISVKQKTEGLNQGGDSERSQGSNCDRNPYKEESVPLHLVQNLKNQLQNYKDTIANINQKILHLEKLIEIKDNVINELKEQLERSQR